MEQGSLRPAPWLICDHAHVVWKRKPFSFRFQQYGQRISIIPVLDVNWEQGMVSISVGWLNICLLLDYDFNPNWDASEEVEYPLIRN